MCTVKGPSMNLVLTIPHMGFHVSLAEGAKRGTLQAQNPGSVTIR